MQVRQGTTVIATIGSTFNSGNGPVDVLIPLIDGTTYNLFWSTAGSYSYEVGVQILDAQGTEIYSMPFNSSALTGTQLHSFNAACPIPCAGNPSPGNTLSSVATVCSGVSFTLSLQNNPAVTGLTYQWMSSDDGSVWTNISGATTATHTLSQTSATYYKCAVTCDGNTAESSAVQVGQNPPTECYCVPSTTYGCDYGDVVARVILNTLDNNSGTGCPSAELGYSDYTYDPLLTTTLQAGTSYGCTVYAGEYSQGYAAWIDYNDDGIFDNSTERIGYSMGMVTGSGQAGVLGSNATFPVVLACNPPVGSHRLRVRSMYNTSGIAVTPCESNFYGETEDYLITIAAPPPCPAPSGLSASGATNNSIQLNWTAGCIETAWEVEYGPVGFTPGNGITVPAGTLPFTLSGLDALTNYHAYVRADCGVDGISTSHGPVAFTTLGPPSCIPAPSFPADGNSTCLGTGSITLSWPTAANATNYTVIVDGITVSADQSGTTYTANGLAAGPHTWSVTPSNSYGSASDCNTWTFDLTAPPSGNTISTALPSGTLPFSTTGDNLAANCWTSTYAGPNNQSSPDVWYAITTECAGELNINVCTSGFDTYAHLLDANGIHIASNDDEPQPGCYFRSSSFTDIPVAGNSTYYLVIEGWSSNTGTFTLSGSLTPSDTDGDGTCDTNDGCPSDPDKIAPGQCGCGSPDTDSDSDGTADCNDACPADPNKIVPGICGCGEQDIDLNANNVCDAQEGGPQVKLGLVHAPGNKLEVRLLPNGDFNTLISNTVITVRWETTPGVSVSSPQYVDPAYMGATGPIISTGTSTDGIYSYATFSTIGFGSLSDAGLAWTANTEVPFFQLNYTNTSDRCVTFEVVDDAYQTSSIINWFISLDAYDRTGGYIPGSTQVISYPSAICQNTTATITHLADATITAAQINDSFDGCSGILYSLSQSSFNCSDLGEQIVTLTATDPYGVETSCSSTVTVIAADSDGDGTHDCDDLCPTDPDKIAPGVCGCGNVDVDVDNDNVCDTDETEPLVKLGLVHAPGNKLEVRLLPDGFFNDLVSNTVITIRWETTPGVSVSSPQYVDPAYMGATGPIISTGTSTDGIYSYATFSTIGFGSLANAGLAWTANTEVPFFQLNYSNTSDRCVTFEVVDDAYQTAQIISWFISLNALDRTDGYIPGSTQVIVYPSAICQNTTATITHLADATITAVHINDSFDGCSGILYSLSQSSFNCSELGEQIVTLTATDPYGVETSCSSTVTVIAADTDGDGTHDCGDLCPTDPDKIAPGVCGCGNVDVDVDNDNVCDTDETEPLVKLGLVHAPGNKLEVRLLPDGFFNDLVSNTVITIRWETTPGVSVSSPQYVDPAYMGATGPIISTGTSTDGIYSYATFSTIGFGSLANAGLAWTANTEVPFFQLNYSNTSDRCVTFEVVDDAYQTAQIISWFISLNALDRTDGYIPGSTQVNAYPEALCQDATATVTHDADALITVNDVNAGFLGCTGITYSLNNDTFTCADLGQQTVTLTAIDGYNVTTTCTATITVISADTDNDGTVDCSDLCPTDPLKTSPGLCGCGVVDVDSDNDNVCDLFENEPNVKLGISEVGNDQLELRLLPDGFFNDLVSNTVITVRWETTPGVSVFSPQYVDPAYLGATGPIISTGISTDDIYSYATFSTIGFGNLSDQGIAWTGGVEVPFFRVNYTNPSGACLDFEVVDDAYQTGENISWYISLNALEKADGYIPGSTSAIGYPAAICQDVTVTLDVNGEAIVTPAMMNTGTFLDCVTPILSLDQSLFTCADVGVNTVTLSVAYPSGPTLTCSSTVTVISTLEAFATPGEILCNGGSTTVNVTATGGSGSYTGTGPQTVQAGPYSFTVTDSNGCTSTVSGTITEPAALVASASIDAPILCAGGETTITVSATGGTGTISGTGTFPVEAGPYSFTVTDANGCTSTVSGTITEPAALVASAAIDAPILCAGGETTITVSATGGTGTISGTGTFPVEAGPYSFTVTDANGCTSTVSGTITEPAALVASASIDAPILCAGGETTITVSATGGTGTISGTGTFPVEAGPYSFTVTDANGCTATVSGTITEPAALVASASIDAPILCAGGETTITVSAIGGTGTISGTGTFPVEAGPYSYTVTDANGCTSTVSGTITEPAVLTVTASSDAIPCPGGSTVVTISATGGTGALEGTGTFTLEAGTYTFSVTDANGCSASTVHEVIFMLQDSDGDGICDDLDQCPGGPEPGTACDDGNPGTIDDMIGNDCLCTGTPAIQIHVRAMLDGPYNTTNGLMNDGLRAGNHLPVSHPYGSAPFNLPAAASISPAILTVSGDDAIVDWVIIELRDNIDPSVLVARRAALLQRDGDVVELDGVNPVLFSEAPGAYHVAIRHRNHFGAMTASSVSLGPVVQLVDFIDPATITFGLDARKELEPGTMALWAGNARVDSQLKYSGAQNDRDPILVKIGGLIPTAVVFGYHVEDVNLNGIVSYAGAGNDRDPILVNLDGSVLGVRIEQMP